MISSLDIIKKYEGYRDKAYKCPAGKWTIGYGFTYNPLTKVEVKKGDTITEDEAYDWLIKIVNNLRKDILSSLPHIKQYQLEALVSFAFNIGLGSFKKSTMYKMLKLKEMDKAANEFPKWVNCKGKKLKGLVARREAERNLFIMEIIVEETNKVCDDKSVSLFDRMKVLREKLKNIWQ